MMNETSKGRRLTGKLAILTAAVIALPLTATVVPVFAEDEAATVNEEKKVEIRKHKVVIVKSEDGKPVEIDMEGDADAPFVKKIEKDGKTIILRSNKELSEADVAKMVADAEASRAKAEATAEADGDGKKITKRVIVHSTADANGAHAFSWSGDGGKMVEDMKIATFIPDIDISEIRGKCEEGQPVTTDVEGFDGQNKSRVKIVMCGKGQAKVARQHAIQGLKEARDEIKADGEMPESIRKDVIKKLEENIEQLERELKNAPESGGDA